MTSIDSEEALRVVNPVFAAVSGRSAMRVRGPKEAKASDCAGPRPIRKLTVRSVRFRVRRDVRGRAAGYVLGSPASFRYALLHTREGTHLGPPCFD